VDRGKNNGDGEPMRAGTTDARRSEDGEEEKETDRKERD